MAETEKMEKPQKPTRGWYVLRAISGKEASVKELLDGAMINGGLGKYLFQVLIPTEKVMVVRGGKKIEKEKNLFPGYVFVDCILTGELISQLSTTTNVIDFLRGRGKDKKPERLSEADVKRMLGTADEFNGQAQPEVIDFLVGEHVMVKEGPFSNFPGEIEEVQHDKNKLKVAVKIFGRKTIVELDPWQVDRV